jgi:hypothetical protein
MKARLPENNLILDDSGILPDKQIGHIVSKNVKS